MKTKSLLFVVTVVTILALPNVNLGQAPNLGAAANFVLFSTTGAVSNAGISQITGNAGANTGAVSGFSGLNGGVYNADATSAQCSIDLLVAYNQLNSAVATSNPGVLLGNGQVLDAGVYAIPAAASLNLGLTLDGQGNPNAVFIIQINGAFSTTTSSTIYLINGASACNVFWKVEGAVSMAAGSTMTGTIIANNAAISMATGDTLEGRALSTTGAVAVDGLSANVGCGFIVLPIELLSFTGACNKGKVVLNWSTASETNNKYFTVEKNTGGQDWQVLGTVQGAGNSSSLRNYSFTDKMQDQPNSYYRLEQTDFDGNTRYGIDVAIEKCGADVPGNVTLYPNPSSGKFDLLYPDDRSQVISMEIFNSLGEKVYESIGLPSNIDLHGKASGLYFVQVHLNSKTINREMLVRKD